MISLFNILSRFTVTIINHNLIFIPFSNFDINVYSLKPVFHAQFINSLQYVLKSLFFYIIFSSSFYAVLIIFGSLNYSFIHLNRLFIDVISYISALVFFNLCRHFSTFPSSNDIIYTILFFLVEYLFKFPSNLNSTLIRKALTSPLTPLNFFRSGSFSESLGNNYKVRISNGFF